MVFSSQNEITAEEGQLISQLRERVKDELSESIRSMTTEDQDLFLVRWLRARDLHLDNATKMLRNSLEWRKERNADKAVDQQIHPFFSENFPFSYAGPDKHGHPVFLIPLAAWDFRKILNNPDRLNEFDDVVTNYFEIVCKHIREEHLRRHETGHPPVTQFVFLFDVENYSYGQLVSIGAMKKMLLFASTYEAHYPEVMFKGVFINCPFFFNIFMAILRPVLAPKTMSKLVCYSNILDWQKDMVEFLDPAKISERYGGTLKANDEYDS